MPVVLQGLYDCEHVQFVLIALLNNLVEKFLVQSKLPNRKLYFEESKLLYRKLYFEDVIHALISFRGITGIQLVFYV